MKRLPREFMFEVAIVLAIIGAIAFLGLSPAADMLLLVLLVVMLVIFTRRNR